MGGFNLGSLSDFIEQYLRQMLSVAGTNAIEIQRRELARIFRCSPSQINYVLETRFSNDQGFVIDSRRGGGGYIRIRQIPLEGSILEYIEQMTEGALSSQEADALLQRLQDDGFLDEYSADIIRTVLYRQFNSEEGDSAYECADNKVLRAKILRAVLEVILALNTE
jgi:transcriptional regulator CtsR